jgi:phosphomannomutase/phosphoglucomutase
MSEVTVEKITQEIFRAYDIRGVVGETLSVEVLYQIGCALGTLASSQGESTIVVARDGRLSGGKFLTALSKGILSTGVDVIDIGKVPTPLLYFATVHTGYASGVMITGSHNPPEYNGVKMVVGGKTLAGEDIQEVYRCIQSQKFSVGEGSLRREEMKSTYIDAVLADVTLSRPLKIVVDCGNGVAGAVAPKLFKQMQCAVRALYCDVDGAFPNHHPDPSKPENLQDLIQVVRQEKADIGLAFDGDGDRLGIVTQSGKIIWPDRQLILLAKDVLSRNPGATIIYDVKSTRHIAECTREMGGKPLMCRSGHSYVKALMRETGALLGGEMSGHIFIKERWNGFDDALYAAARFLEIVANDGRTVDEIFSEIPESISTPELTIAIAEDKKFQFVESLVETGDFGEQAEVNTIDGLRVDFPDGWGLVRASNTTPCLVLRFEAETNEALIRIQEIFRAQLRALAPAIELPF